MEHFIILISEVGAAGAIVFGLFLYLFKNTFTQMMEPLSKAIDKLSFNVGTQTELIKEHKVRLDNIETRVEGHETRITVIEHDHDRGNK